MRGRWSTALGFVLSAALLYGAFRGVPFGEVVEAIRGSNPLYWASAVVVSLMIFPLRAIRWRIILDPVAPNIAFGPLWRAVAIGMGANILPGRMGELVRAYVLTHEEPRVPFTASFASLVVDRTFDAVVLLALLLLATLDPAFSSNASLGERTVNAAIGVTAAAVAGAILVLYAAVFAPRWLEGIAGGIARRVTPRWEERARALVRGFASGLGVLRDPRKMVAVIAWTVAHWVVNAAAFWLGFQALGLDVPFTAALFVQCVVAIFVAVPSAPGFFGPFEAGGALALGVYGVSTVQGGAWALGYHILTLVPITLIGAWYVARLGLTWGELRRSPAPTAGR